MKFLLRIIYSVKYDKGQPLTKLEKHYVERFFTRSGQEVTLIDDEEFEEKDLTAALKQAETARTELLQANRGYRVFSATFQLFELKSVWKQTLRRKSLRKRKSTRTKNKKRIRHKLIRFAGQKTQT